MSVCQHCGGLCATENLEMIAGRPCHCHALKIVTLPPRPSTGHPLADAHIEREVRAALEALTPILIDRITEAVRDMLVAGVKKSA